MRRHKKVYVKAALFHGNTSPPITNRRFAPKLSDIRNQMYRATIKYRHSRIDQENVASKVNEWNSRHEDNLFFRPHLNEDTDEDDTQQNSEMDDEVNDEGKEETVYLTSHRTSQDGKTLLFVHQTAWQRRLLERYGDVCLLDATYKTTKYALPVFCCGKDQCRLPDSGIFCHSRWNNGVHNGSSRCSSWMEPWLESRLFFHRSLWTRDPCNWKYL